MLTLRTQPPCWKEAQAGPRAKKPKYPAHNPGWVSSQEPALTRQLYEKAIFKVDLPALMWVTSHGTKWNTEQPSLWSLRQIIEFLAIGFWVGLLNNNRYLEQNGTFIFTFTNRNSYFLAKKCHCIWGTLHLLLFQQRNYKIDCYWNKAR